MRFYTGRMFPRRYRNSIFIAEHGSHDRDDKIGKYTTPYYPNRPHLGYRVVNVKLGENNFNSANHEIFAYVSRTTVFFIYFF